MVTFGIFFGVCILIMLIFMCSVLFMTYYYDMIGKRVEESYLVKNSDEMNAETDLMLLNTMVHNITLKFIEDNYCGKTPITSSRLLNNATIPSHDTVVRDADTLVNTILTMLSPYYVNRIRLYYIKQLELHVRSLIIDEIKVYTENVYERRQTSSHIENLSKEEKASYDMKMAVTTFLNEEGITNTEAQRLIQTYGDIPDNGLSEIANSDSPSMSKDARAVVNLKAIQTSLGLDTNMLNNLIMGLPVDPLEELDFPSELGL